MRKPIPNRFRRRLVRLIRDLKQMIRDMEWWNENRTDEEPMDMGAERVILAKAEKALEALERGDRAGHTKHVKEMSEAATRCYDAMKE